jgi:DNA sulfur modification protein DndD
MLLTELVLHNFGPYRGRHVVQLAPPRPEQPVILFGGLNGAGKTTILDALHLALYGRRARSAGRSGQTYDEYLRRSIHRAVADREGAAVEVAFMAPLDGAEVLFRVHRSWESGSKTVKERVVVWRGDEMDRLLTERWDDFVEEVLPLEIAGLFFFDGEKIEALADPDRAARVIATAIESLLGLDLVDRLSTDLVALERRQRATMADARARSEIDKLQAVAETSRQAHAAALQEQGALQNEVDRARAARRKVEMQFKREGGELYEQRAVLEQQRLHLSARMQEARDALSDLASGVLPLRVVAPLLERVVKQHDVERETIRRRILTEALETRDEAVLGELATHVPADALKRMRSALKADRDVRASTESEPPRLHLSEEASRRLDTVWHTLLDDAQASARARLDEVDRLRVDAEAIDRSLAAIPSRDAIERILIERGEAQQRLSEAEARLAVALERTAVAERAVEDAESRLDRALREATGALARREEGDRIVRHAAKVRDTLGSFRATLLARHLSRIEAAVLDSLRRLMRKEHLVVDLRIDPNTFELSLFDRDGENIAAERLSAGERQLLAVALLWGLGRVAGKRLPTVIDTPLGRLDSVHRRLLVDRYFPAASEQVILLSTDEEIDADLLERLSPTIGRSFEIRHDDERGETSLVPGYFWDVEDVA